MKNLFFTFLVAITVLGCSDDDNSPSGNLISVKFDNQEINFRNIQVEEDIFPAEGNTPGYTEITINATANGNVFSFFVIKGETGPDSVYDISYADGDLLYNATDTQSIITSNGDEKHLVGSFSGSMSNFAVSPATTIQITDGTFDIKY